MPPSSACGSFASSPSATSLFSKASYATDSTSLDLESHNFQPTPSTSGPNPAAKAASIHLPLHLPAPPCPLEEVDIASLIVDHELEGAPVGFAVGKLRSIGSSLLQAASATTMHLPSGDQLPEYLPVTLPPVTSPTPIYLPSHILSIRSNDSPRRLLLPVHGLLYAASSPTLSFLSSQPERQPHHPNLPGGPRPYPSGGDKEGTAHLPVVELSLPSSSAFTILQGWIYLRAPLLLLSSLLPCPPPSTSPSSALPSSLSHLLNPSTPTSSSFSQSTPESLTQSLAALPSSLLLKHVHIVHGVWSAAVALQVGEEDMWRVMGVAWQFLVAALALRERERRLRASTPATSDEE
ncbi:hypothetical protein JCM11641_001461 [Rhodosporidiobolus odoratus]